MVHIWVLVPDRESDFPLAVNLHFLHLCSATVIADAWSELSQNINFTVFQAKSTN